MADGVVPQRLLAMDISAEQLSSVPKPQFVNTVTTYTMSNTSLNGELITMLLPGFCYNAQSFAAIKMRLKYSMILGFCSGIAVCPGSRDLESAHIAALRFTKLLVEAGIYAEFSSFHVHNIVMSVYAPFEIYLPPICKRFSECAEYKNSNFPGLTFRMRGDTKIVFNIFVSGRVVITASKSPEHSYRAWWWLYTNVLLPSKMDSAPGTTSSARFRTSLHLRSSQLAENCSRLSTRHARRKDGPLASSGDYDSMLSTPSLRTPSHVPSTPRSATMTPRTVVARASAAAATSAEDRTALARQRIERHFAGHTTACPYVRVSRSNARREWFDMLRRAEAAGDAAAQNDAVMQPHIVALCCSNGAATLDVATRSKLAANYVDQLMTAVGLERCRLLIGAEAPLRGHAIECPWLNALFDGDDGTVAVNRAQRLDDAQRDIECALALAVTDNDDTDLRIVVGRHTIVGCCVDDAHDFAAVARTFLTELCVLRRQLDAETPHVCDVHVDDVTEPERIFALDTIRALAEERRWVDDDDDDDDDDQIVFQCERPPPV